METLNKRNFALGRILPVALICLLGTMRDLVSGNPLLVEHFAMHWQCSAYRDTTVSESHVLKLLKAYQFSKSVTNDTCFSGGEGVTAL